MLVVNFQLSCPSTEHGPLCRVHKVHTGSSYDLCECGADQTCSLDDTFPLCSHQTSQHRFQRSFSHSFSRNRSMQRSKNLQSNPSKNLPMGLLKNLPSNPFKNLPKGLLNNLQRHSGGICQNTQFYRYYSLQVLFKYKTCVHYKLKVL